ncbi:hypothetical protein FHY31_001708 [Xanthomonas euvesicatoria]|uniref:Uncharacterized protein n=1 Tax=Xanthomonas euvesicatoria TaxID=456327 RepID=A0AAW3U4Z6_XANEU|nr:hypothetical protein [Xanthomonas euvesicatoria]MBB4869964.1 hypothetical protein [Xanthomonas euvesicatoria]
MNRATATYGSWLYCSKNIQLNACARCHASVGRYGVPSASQNRIALDSVNTRPSSRSTIGTLPLGFLARYSGVRVCPATLSTSTQ